MQSSPYLPKTMKKHKEPYKATRRQLPPTDHGNGGVSTRQALVYFAIVVACFIVVYPRMIHPMLKIALGFGEKPASSHNQPSDYPPQMLHHGKPIPGAAAGMRPPPAARGDHSATDAGSGGGGGVMGMLLPIYAGGLFLYLLYAASKAYNSDGSSGRPKDAYDETYALITERLSGLDLEKIISGEDKDGASEINKLAEFLRQRNAGVRIDPSTIDELQNEDNVEEVGSYSSDSTRQSIPQTSSASADCKQPSPDHDTDELLRKCENEETMTPEEMLRLKVHLAQMEGRMNKLMSALQTVNAKTAEVAGSVSELATKELVSEDEDEDGMSDGLEESGLSEEQIGYSDGDTDVEVLEMQEMKEIYDIIESSSDDELLPNPEDPESVGVRRRHLETCDSSEAEL